MPDLPTATGNALDMVASTYGLTRSRDRGDVVYGNGPQPLGRSQGTWESDEALRTRIQHVIQGLLRHQFEPTWIPIQGSVQLYDPASLELTIAEMQVPSHMLNNSFNNDYKPVKPLRKTSWERLLDEERY